MSASPASYSSLRRIENVADGAVKEFTVTAADSNGAHLELYQTAAPGYGIPLHIHTKQQEDFKVIFGRFGVSLNCWMRWINRRTHITVSRRP